MMEPDLISQADHIPVLLEPILENISPVGGVWIDATLVLVDTREPYWMLVLSSFLRLTVILMFFL